MDDEEYGEEDLDEDALEEEDYDDEEDDDAPVDLGKRGPQGNGDSAAKRRK